jgi:Flp pilus assembly pilin Flp
MKQSNFLVRLRRIRRDHRGIAAVEFALIAPAFLTLLMGTFEVGHQLYTRALLNGATEKAARDSGLASGIRNQAVIDAQVKKVVGTVIGLDSASTKITFARRNYLDVDDVGKMEDFTDSDNDNRCDKGEQFEDANDSGSWDERGSDGQGGARAAVLYTVTVKYKRLFPVGELIGMSNDVTVKASTVLRNQPYDQTHVKIKAKNCPAEDR